MSFSNLRDHCAFALTVLLSEKGMGVWAAAKVSVRREDEELRAELPGSRDGLTWGSTQVPPLPCAHRGGLKGPPGAAFRLCRTEGASSLLLASSAAVLTSPVLFGGWRGASK